MVEYLKELDNNQFLMLRSLNKDDEENEIDIYIKSESLIQLKQIFLEQGLLVDHRLINHPHCKYTDVESKINDFFHIDMVSDIHVFDKSRGIRINKKDLFPEVLANSDCYKYVFMLLHAVLDKKYSMDNKYTNILTEMRGKISNKELSQVINNLILPKILFNKIEKAYLNSEERIINWFYKPFVRIILLTKKPYGTLKWIYRKFKRLLSNWFNKQFDEKIIVFMGADGSGKTTMINTLIDQLQEEDWQYVHLGNKSQLLPTTRLIHLIRKKNKKNPITKKSFQENDTVSKSHSLISETKNKILTINYYLEVYIHIQYLRIKNLFFSKHSRLVIDRYIYDKFYENINRFSVFKFFPKPNLIVLMDAPINILLSRKSEHNRNTIEDFKKRYNNFLLKQRYSKAIKIDSSTPISDGVSKIKKVIDYI